MTQYEAERSALAEFTKHNPDGMVKSYMFEKLIHVPTLRPDISLSGYFLCGRIEFFLAGRTYGPERIMANWANNKVLVLILYDNPKTGAHVASSLCSQAEQIDSNR